MGYSNERSIQILIALLKEHGIRRIIASPGATNVTLVGSLQQDPYFEMWSAVDERSAAYMACGMAAQTGEPVVITCTGATASRNYVPGLTEAFYRNLPVLAVTASMHLGRIGQGFPQMLDRTSQMNDLVRISVQVPTVCNKEDEWAAARLINTAILELKRQGGGPAHINLVTSYDRRFDTHQLPSVTRIRRYAHGDELPTMPQGRIAVFVGAHAPFDDDLTEAVDAFCAAHDAIVLCDQTSNYRGRYRVLGNLLSWQDQYKSPLLDIDLLLHIGAISGSYMKIRPKNVWRISPRGDVQDTFKKLTCVFEMSELEFFRSYASDRTPSLAYFRDITTELETIRSETPELPFSNVWCAQQMSGRLPEESVLHLGILNSLRSWNLVETPQTVTCFSNTGGFGIDGGVSSLLGASLADPNKLFIGAVGDLAFFYDMNAIGNRAVAPNMRLMVVNNGRGTEFRNYWHPAAVFGDEADRFMAAAGHFGKQSPDLLRHYATDLGFEYLAASDKGSFLGALDTFCDPEVRDRPVLLEVFTDSQLESEALHLMHNIKVTPAGSAKQMAKEILGARGVKIAKRLMGK